MKRIFDPALLNFYLQKHEIPSLFDTPDLAFSLYQFEKGERLDTLNPAGASRGSRRRRAENRPGSSQ